MNKPFKIQNMMILTIAFGIKKKIWNWI